MSMMKIIRYGASTDQCFRYFISGEWTFDLLKGVATHQITDIIQKFERAKPYDTSSSEHRINSLPVRQNPAFRLRFKDVKSLIQRSEAQNASSFARALWQSHKVTLRKPVMGTDD
jgi:hypothetical protein